MTSIKSGPKDTTIQIPWDASKMQVGSGYVTHEGQAVASPFVPFTLAEPSSTDPDVVYEHILISNEEEFQQEISSSMRAKASIFGVGLEASFEQLRDINYNAKSVTSILRCTVSHEPVGYRDIPQLHTSASSLLEQAGGLARFAELYGDYFVAGYKSSSSLSAIITYTGSSRKQIDEFKGNLSAGKGIASIEGAAAYKQRAENSNLQHTIKWHSSGLALSLLTMDPGPDDVQRILKDYTSCKPKPQMALLKHYSLVDTRISRMEESGGPSYTNTEEIKKAELEAQTIQTRLQNCHLLGANDVRDQVSGINRALAALQTSSKAWRETLAEHRGKLWRLKKRLDLMLEGEKLITGARLSSRSEWFRQYDSPGHTRCFDFGAVGIQNGLIEGEIQHSDVMDCRVHGKGFQKQENTITIWPTNAIIVGFRVHSYWDDGTNGKFKISEGGVLEDHVCVRFVTQEHRGGHWAVEAWYLDRTIYAPQG